MARGKITEFVKLAELNRYFKETASIPCSKAFLESVGFFHDRNLEDVSLESDESDNDYYDDENELGSENGRRRGQNPQPKIPITREDFSQ